MSSCRGCGHENEDDASFCSGCGSPLAAVLSCAQCGAGAAADQRFCGTCGNPLAPARARGGAAGEGAGEPSGNARGAPAPGAGERKQVTVLFADVQGSMDLSGAVEMDLWWTIMQRFYELLSEGIERFGGRVDRFTGDGVMAVFGAPAALEDHARRACLAALWLRPEIARYAEQLRRERELSFAVRIGINSGEIVTGTLGDDLHAEYTVIGHTAGLAQRMESVAEPGGVFITEATARLVRSFFVLEERGAMRVKGVERPLQVFALVGAEPTRTPYDLTATSGLSGFVGRDRELALLQHQLERTLAGEGAVVSVVGEAGIGKTRLCHEFLERNRRDGVGVWRANALAHMRAVPFAPVLELLRDTLGIAGLDDAEARRRVCERLAAIGEAREESTKLLLDFLGIADPASPPLRLDPEARQRHASAILNRLVCARQGRQPGIVLLEDLHWLDASSEAMLESLARTVAGTRTMLLTTRRPEYAAAWLPREGTAELRLEPLGTGASERLLAELLGPDPSLDGVAQLVYEHAEGNPFFIEEIVKTLAESRTLVGVRGAYRLTRTIAEVEIPATVQALLAARIDRLGEAEKRALQSAAVLGRQFSEGVLERVSGLPREALGEALSGLLAAELIYPAPQAGEYVFKHSLAERVAYRSLVTGRRAQLHARVATALAELHGDRLDELAALISHHAEQADDPLSAAQWSARAAGWAGFKDPAEALRQWQRARGLLERAPPSADRDQLALGARVMLLNLGWRHGVPESVSRDQFEGQAAQLFDEASALASTVGNVVFETVAVAAYGAVRGMTGHLQDMADFGMRALALANDAGDQGLALSVLPCAVYGLHGLGRFGRILDLLASASAGFPDDPASVVGVTMVCPYAWVLCWQSAARAHAGALPQAFAGLAEALEVARARGDTETEGWVHFSTVQAIQLAGGGDALAQAFAGAEGELSGGSGECDGAGPIDAAALRAMRLALGRDALEHATQALQIAERSGGAYSLGHAWRYLGIAYVLAEQFADAAAVLEQALATWRARRVGLEAEPHALMMLARAQMGLGDFGLACVTAQEAVTLASSRNTSGHELEARIALAQALMRASGSGAAAEVERQLRRAQALIADTGARTLEPRVHGALSELARLRGDAEECERRRAQARRLFSEVGAPLPARALPPALRS